jgi:branched-subunit amino acid aminotransferase/4-amino-4-deoxychorismate lyase
MSRTKRNSPGARPGKPQRNITVRSTRRTPPDLHKLSRALLDLAAAQAEADAQGSAQAKGSKQEAAEAGSAEDHS